MKKAVCNGGGVKEVERPSKAVGKILAQAEGMQMAGADQPPQ
jgi:hypothetical protein